MKRQGCFIDSGLWGKQLDRLGWYVGYICDQDFGTVPQCGGQRFIKITFINVTTSVRGRCPLHATRSALNLRLARPPTRPIRNTGPPLRLLTVQGRSLGGLETRYVDVVRKRQSPRLSSDHRTRPNQECVRVESLRLARLPCQSAALRSADSFKVLFCSAKRTAGCT